MDSRSIILTPRAKERPLVEGVETSQGKMAGRVCAPVQTPSLDAPER